MARDKAGKAFRKGSTRAKGAASGMNEGHGGDGCTWRSAHSCGEETPNYAHIKLSLSSLSFQEGKFLPLYTGRKYMPSCQGISRRNTFHIVSRIEILT